ncbi:hypothetical protein Tco_0533705 [Tanacetum coccineum]
MFYKLQLRIRRSEISSYTSTTQQSWKRNLKVNKNVNADSCSPFHGGGYRANALGIYQAKQVNPSSTKKEDLEVYQAVWDPPNSAYHWTEPYINVREQNKPTILFRSRLECFSVVKKRGDHDGPLRERMELDLEARLMGETLVLNRSLDHFFEGYIELNDLNVPLELRRDQVDDLMPTIKEGEVVEEFRARNDTRMVSKFFRYLSDCDYDKEIHFAVLEDMDAYRDEGMGDVIFDEPFLREDGINAKRFEGMITIHNGNEEVTYQMARSHPMFKHHTNEQCNKIPPLLKVSEEDKMNGILHSYQKLKGFYKGVLNLGPEYVRDAKMEEWLTRGHISDLAERKEIDNVDEESTIWKFRSVGALKLQDGCST